MSTQPWEPRVSRLEGICEQVNHRLGTIELSVESLRREMSASSESLRREMSASFRWVVGMVLSGWLTTILAIFFHH